MKDAGKKERKGRKRERYLQLPTLAVVHVARDPHGDLPGRSIDAVLKALVVRGPGDKVPDVQAEDAGVGVHRRPGGGDVAALGDDIGRRRRREGDPMGQTGQGGQGESSLEGRHLVICILGIKLLWRRLGEK